MKIRPYQIILADDHVIVRQGIKKIIEEIPGLKVIGEASKKGFVGLLKNLTPDLVVMEISISNSQGIEIISELKKNFPDLKVLILTMHKDKRLLHAAISAGADGYILKEDPDKELYSAIEKIQQGRVYISPHLAEDMTNDWVREHRRIQKSPLERLTKREKEVLKLIVEGKSSKEIADLLSISKRTAENHRNNLMKKLGMKKMTDLVRYTMQKGYLF